MPCAFIAPTDPRWISTLDAITAELVSDSLVYRYNDASPDGLVGEGATFSMCSFWWVEALARAGRVEALARAGRLDEARLALEKMLTYANHVGLYSDELLKVGTNRYRTCSPASPSAAAGTYLAIWCLVQLSAGSRRGTLVGAAGSAARRACQKPSPASTANSAAPTNDTMAPINAMVAMVSKA
jgi:Glycosyl hydrolases family 15